jgi:hypothetical protein
MGVTRVETARASLVATRHERVDEVQPRFDGGRGLQQFLIRPGRCGQLQSDR